MRVAWIALFAATWSGGLFATEESTLRSANQYPWDISSSTGAVNDGGDDAFDGYGVLGLRVFDANGGLLSQDTQISSFNFSADGRTFYSGSHQNQSGVVVGRTIYAPSDANYLRYFDSFTNNTGSAVKLQVTLGGNLGSDESTTLARTSSGGASASAADHWLVIIQNDQHAANGPAMDDPVVGMLHGNTSAFKGYLSFSNDGGEVIPLPGLTELPANTRAWSGNGDDDLSFLYEFTLAPGQTSSLVFFLYRGQAEYSSDEDGNGSYDDGPIAAGQIDLARSVLTGLAANPDYAGLTSEQIGRIVNLTPVPEPATWSLLVFGSVWLALVWVRRRR